MAIARVAKAVLDGQLALQTQLHAVNELDNRRYGRCTECAAGALVPLCLGFKRSPVGAKCVVCKHVATSHVLEEK